MTHLLYFKRIWFRQVFSSANRRTASPTAIVPRPQSVRDAAYGYEHTHRIHGAAIYGNIYHQYTPFMLAYIPYMDPMG